VNEAPGRVVSIWRYPVKSMLGEELNSSYVGDRAYAVVDQKTGKVASAKNPRKWGKLFDFRSVFIDPPQLVENIPPVRITFPDGTHIFSNHDGIDYTTSKVLAQDVRLMTAKLDKPSYKQSVSRHAHCYHECFALAQWPRFPSLSITFASIKRTLLFFETMLVRICIRLKWNISQYSLA
jgi:hypothetical protein